MEPFIGQILMFGGNFAPRGWALCDGQLLPISQNTALFSILGTMYGGDGRTTFGLPDLRGRTAVHAGSGPGLPVVRQGEKSGNPTTTLTEQNLPSHTHGHTLAVGCFSDEAAGGDNPENKVVGPQDTLYHATADASMAPLQGTITNTGNNTSFSNISPFQGVYYIIALVGTFPSRN